MGLDHFAAQFKTSHKALLICFSHLRWNFVFQRPQHILTRAAREYEVLYFEEPVYEAVDQPQMRLVSISAQLHVVTPVLPLDYEVEDAIEAQRALLDTTLEAHAPDHLVFWYYTPMALPFSDHVNPSLCIYDCMDELSAFKGAPPQLAELERQLFKRADLVFTGGQSLYEAKRRQHHAIYPFPSSVDVAHFKTARLTPTDPADQANIPHPRIGFFGVIDERFDASLAAQAAAELPDYQFVMIGPVVKISEDSLPKAPNIHWLGSKSYNELPRYLGQWNAGWMPFALNRSTRYISPTKTPEFLAAGLPVVSTAIVDVVRTYGAEGLVEIADASDISEKLRIAVEKRPPGFLDRVDAYLAQSSWEQTWLAMSTHMARAAAIQDIVTRRRLNVLRASHV